MGKVKTVECKEHSHAWSGKIPCTGIRRCIYCGKPTEDMDKLSMAIIAMEVHVSSTNDRLKQAWEVIHAELVESQKPTTNKASTKFLDRLEEILKGVPWAGTVCLKVEALRLVEKLRTLL